MGQRHQWTTCINVAKGTGAHWAPALVLFEERPAVLPLGVRRSWAL